MIRQCRKAEDEGRSSIAENLRDKVVFVGHMATGSVDLREMPFSVMYPAVGGHATALSNILDRKILSKAPRALNAFIVLVVCVLLSLCTRRGKKMYVNLAIMFAIFISYVLFAFAFFAIGGFWVYAFAPSIALLITYVAIAVSHYEAVRYEKKVLENELLIAKTIQESFWLNN